MNTGLLLGACVALFTATASVRADLNPEDLSGRYRGQGENYVTDVSIRKFGDRYEIRWERPNANYSGVGIREGNILSASFGISDASGVAVYRIERDRLVGKFTAPNMNRLAAETLTPIGAFVEEPAREPFAAESRVAARWQGASYYLATVKSHDGGKYRILYDDGTPSESTSEDLLPIARANEIIPGRRVLACWSTGRLYPGTVLEPNGAESVMVKWDDGSAPSAVAKQKIALLPAAAPLEARVPAPEPRDAAFAVGTRVAARWAITSFYLATIQSRDGDTYHVLYDDNDQADVTRADLLPVVQPNQIAVGTRVLACWMSAKMYAGTVLEVKDGENVIVKWDDGSAPSPVAVNKVALLPAGFQ